MFTIRVAMRAFLFGLVLGVLVAPRSGSETRRLLEARFVALMDALMELLALPSEPIELPDRVRSARERSATHAG